MDPKKPHSWKDAVKSVDGEQQWITLFPLILFFGLDVVENPTLSL
jgi:hypothetical protein